MNKINKVAKGNLVILLHSLQLVFVRKKQKRFHFYQPLNTKIERKFKKCK